jgi:hypothetical protein
VRENDTKEGGRKCEGVQEEASYAKSVISCRSMTLYPLQNEKQMRKKGGKERAKEEKKKREREMTHLVSFETLQ